MRDDSGLADDLALIVDLANQGGRIAMGYFGDNPEVWLKEGQSPVSEADYAVDTFLKTQLIAKRPDYGWLSEETADDVRGRLNTSRVFVVDPIDGTRGFLNGSKQWCVSIAVVEDGRPVAGVLACPALNETYAAALGSGSRCNGRILNITPARQTLRITGPRAIQTAFMKAHEKPVERMDFVPSLAYRIAMVANGAADLAIARYGAKDWDLAAADLILQEAGGRLTAPDGENRQYNALDTRHPSLLACSSQTHDEMLVLAASLME